MYGNTTGGLLDRFLKMLTRKRPTSLRPSSRIAAIRILKKARTTYRRRRRIGGPFGLELKRATFSASDLALIASGAAASSEMDPAATSTIFAPTKGDGLSNRDGDRVIIKSIEFHGCIQEVKLQDQADPPPHVGVTVAIVQDRQTNGAQLNSEDVFDNPGATADLNMSLIRDQGRISRYKILKKWVIECPLRTGTTDGANTAAYAEQFTHFDWYKKVNIPVSFIGDLGTIADCQTNSLHVLAFATDVTTNPVLHYNGVITFLG